MMHKYLSIIQKCFNIAFLVKDTRIEGQVQVSMHLFTTNIIYYK